MKPKEHPNGPTMAADSGACIWSAHDATSGSAAEELVTGMKGSDATVLHLDGFQGLRWLLLSGFVPVAKGMPWEGFQGGGEFWVLLSALGGTEEFDAISWFCRIGC